MRGRARLQLPVGQTILPVLGLIVAIRVGGVVFGMGHGSWRERGRGGARPSGWRRAGAADGRHTARLPSGGA